MIKLVWKVVSSNFADSVVADGAWIKVPYLPLDFDLKVEPLVRGSLLFAFDDFDLAVREADLLGCEVLLGLADVVEGPDMVLRGIFMREADFELVSRFWDLWNASVELGVDFGRLVELVDLDLWVDLVRVGEGTVFMEWFRPLAFVGLSLGYGGLFDKVKSICRLDCFLESLEESLAFVGDGFGSDLDLLVYDLDLFWEVLNG